MRFVSVLLALILASPATAQTPPAEKAQPYCRVQTESGFFFGADSETCNALIKEMQKKRYGDGPVPPLPPACSVDNSEIVAEQKASDQRLRQMKRREEIIPLQHQYEQEMYYEDRRAKLYEKTCGKPAPFYKPSPDMRKKACEALGVVCKPVKHW